MGAAPEIEVKYLDVDIDDIRERLQKVGAHLEHPMRLMRRHQFDHADRRWQKTNYGERLRIRDEGDKLTVTYKRTTLDSKYAHEIETTIGSYDDMKELLQALGFVDFAYQESKRETWQLGSVEIVIDEWPWLKPYIEIEGPTEADVRQVTEKLGFDWQAAKHGSVNTAYRAQYPKMTKERDIGDVPEVRFDLPVPKYLEDLM